MTGKKKFDDYRRVRSDLFNVDANYKGFYKHVACPVYALRQIYKNFNELTEIFPESPTTRVTTTWTLRRDTTTVPASNTASFPPRVWITKVFIQC